jgi:DNA helicase-2/ATP-dependent DNA helicase PcrA
VLDELIAKQTENDLAELFDLIVEKTGYEAYVRDDTQEGEDRWGNVVELRKVTKQFSALPTDLALTQLLEQVALIQDVDTLDENVDAATLMTLHTAKGLEYAVVFIVGMEEGLMPHSRSFEDPAQMEEERRLCYVGITRAKERLYLLHAYRRSIYGSSEPGDASRFLADIPQALLAGTGQKRASERASEWNSVKPWDWESSRDRDRDASRGTGSPSWRSGERSNTPRHDADDDDIELGYSDDEPPKRRPSERPERTVPRAPAARPARPQPSTEFKAGDKVKSPAFGTGVVVSSRITGNDEEVQVAFDGVGVKRLITSMANLTKL